MNRLSWGSVAAIAWCFAIGWLMASGVVKNCELLGLTATPAIECQCGPGCQCCEPTITQVVLSDEEIKHLAVLDSCAASVIMAAYAEFASEGVEPDEGIREMVEAANWASELIGQHTTVPEPAR